ncbi:MAG: guanylate kinase [Sphaerospermopsis sp. SIO1G2]|nr:guanylate kinase [Sphaerospermopsis sp. SIO1G2]
MSAVLSLNDVTRNYTPDTETGGFRRGFMFVLSSPSGAGKTTLSRRLLAREKGLKMSVSVTTRAPRPAEEDGVDYSFISNETFDQLVKQKALLEHAQVFNHSYGTPADFINQSLDAGIDVLFDIDWQGTQQLAERCRDDLVSVFILPPSMHELEARLRKRAQDSDEVVTFRMQKATSEISHWDAYDYVVVNRDLDRTLTHITSILHAERRRRARQNTLHEFVSDLCAEATQLGY